MYERQKSKYNTQETDLYTVQDAVAAYGNPTHRIELSRQGVLPEFVQDLMSLFTFSKAELSRLTAISTKTLERHIQSGKRFTGLQSDRLLELAQLYHEGLQTFGQREKFLRWLKSPIAALNNTPPKSWLDTHEGIRMISQELGRIRYGIFA
ncbi:type II toxin-antitoxin system Xre/ParS family antitoxin [Reichenbachiella sp.]|uniref:type II RES/Xre toxin-antitoxin system antitoxin n=1 Tax=Reichenbachiella sp. TaxID=2184521 RepID=UPI003B5AF2CA